MTKSDPTSDRFPRKFGKYHLLGPLAQGGMGALYLAVTGDRGLEKLLVIKTVLPHLADAEYVARFRDEAKIVVQLTHGNLIPVFDAGQVDGELFLAMEFVEGKDLRAVWNRCAKKAVAFPVDVAVYLTKELCRGLGYAHSFGDIRLVHRDVSPPNVLLSYSGEVKLTDFGLASSTLKLEKTAPGIIYGKVAYMSPEQARGEPLDGRSDVYAAGIILWELLTGRQLFPPGKEQPQDLLKRARDPEVQSPSERAPRVPKELDAIVVKSLTAQREDRYATAEEFRDALGAWLAKNSPTTDAARVETFVSGLFEEDIVRERQERAALMEQTRERIKTLPPTDELRRLLENGEVDRDLLESLTDRRQDEGPNLGRRARDKGESEEDRRRRLGRRLVDKVEPTIRGIAVDVPKAGAGGSTVIAGRPDSHGGVALAEAEAQGQPVEVVGQILDGRYRVEHLLGEGGMGRVYLAEHVEIGKRVAVKVLHPVYGRMPDLVERFRREARAASKIGHPNIVDVTDSGTTEDGSVYFVMEYLEGVELAGVIDREGALDIQRALTISTQICRALSAAHASGIIHRDLKPENVFLTSREGSSDFVKVLDFGIAKSSEAEEARSKKLTHPGMAMGTPEYMAPEQAAGRPADERCDVYAVGAILYEMLTGVAPYEGENFMEILTKKATVEPEPPRQLRPEIPESVERLLFQAMARNPAERPPSMEAFEYELTKCLSGRGAAVANILGMFTDPETELTGEKMLQSRRERPTPEGVRAPASDRAALPEPTILAAGTVDEEIPDVAGGGYRALGWVLFSIMLVAGAAAVLYVVKGESGAPRDGRTPADMRGSSKPAPVEDSTEALVDKDEPADPARTDERERRGSVDSPTAEDSVKKPPIKDRDNGSGPKGPPRTDKQAAKLLSEARGHVAKMELPEAEAKYMRVVNSRFRKPQAYLGLSDVAFQQKNLDQAIAYAKKAGDGIAAKMALANAYFKRGDYKLAVGLYDQVLSRNPEHKEAQINARLARQKLGASK